MRKSCICILSIIYIHTILTIGSFIHSTYIVKYHSFLVSFFCSLMFLLFAFAGGRLNYGNEEQRDLRAELGQLFGTSEFPSRPRPRTHPSSDFSRRSHSPQFQSSRRSASPSTSPNSRTVLHRQGNRDYLDPDDQLCQQRESPAMLRRDNIDLHDQVYVHPHQSTSRTVLRYLDRGNHRLQQPESVTSSQRHQYHPDRQRGPSYRHDMNPSRQPLQQMAPYGRPSFPTDGQSRSSRAQRSPPPARQSRQEFPARLAQRGDDQLVRMASASSRDGQSSASSRVRRSPSLPHGRSVTMYSTSSRAPSQRDGPHGRSVTMHSTSLRAQSQRSGELSPFASCSTAMLMTDTTNIYFLQLSTQKTMTYRWRWQVPPIGRRARPRTMEETSPTAIPTASLIFQRIKSRRILQRSIEVHRQKRVSETRTCQNLPIPVQNVLTTISLQSPSKISSKLFWYSQETQGRFTGCKISSITSHQLGVRCMGGA